MLSEGAFGGGYAHLAPCFATITVSRENDTKTYASGSGFGFVFGSGYEWWMGEQWSLGVLARLQVGCAIRICPRQPELQLGDVRSKRSPCRRLTTERNGGHIL
jgi:hypothetical protein